MQSFRKMKDCIVFFTWRAARARDGEPCIFELMRLKDYTLIGIMKTYQDGYEKEENDEEINGKTGAPA